MNDAQCGSPSPRSNLFPDEVIQLKWSHQKKAKQRGDGSFHLWMETLEWWKKTEARDANINNDLLWQNEKFSSLPTCESLNDAAKYIKRDNVENVEVLQEGEEKM
jgi:hypothetical protein